MVDLGTEWEISVRVALACHSAAHMRACAHPRGVDACAPREFGASAAPIARPKARARTEDSEEESDEEQVYEVEEILDSRRLGRKTEYLIKWLDWDEAADNSWETESNIHPDLVAEYKAAASES